MKSHNSVDVPADVDRMMLRSGSWISRRTVLLLATDVEGTDMVGTGVLLQVADRTFLVTAAHVTDEATRKGRELSIVVAKGVCPLPLDGADAVVSPMPGSGDRRNDDVDVAVVPLSATQVEVLTQHFEVVRLGELVAGYAAQESDAIALYGYPAEYSTSLDERVTRCEPFFMLTGASSGPSRSIDERARTKSVVVRVPRNDSYLRGEGSPRAWKTKPPDPHGISGCGVWLLTRVLGLAAMWSEAQIRLVGIVHTQKARHGEIIGVRADAALAFIYQREPALRPAILAEHPTIEAAAGVNAG